MRCLRQARSTEREGSQKGSLGWDLKVVHLISLGVVEAGAAAHGSGSTQEVGEGQVAGTESGKRQRRTGKTLGGPNEEDPDSRRRRWHQISWVTGSYSRMLNKGLISLAYMQEGPLGQRFSSALFIAGPKHREYALHTADTQVALFGCDRWIMISPSLSDRL